MAVGPRTRVEAPQAAPSLDEVAEALGVLAFGYTGSGNPGTPAFRRALKSAAGQRALAARVTLLHCVSQYPAPMGEINLRAMESLSSAFGLPVGLSDHTMGITAPIAAAALGATVIEKHVTVSRSLPGPDHQASLEPDELSDMVRGIREVGLALGSGGKAPARSEMSTRAVARRSLVAGADIRRGERFTVDNLTCKRPGTGISPLRYWDLLGRRALRDYRRDEMIGKHLTEFIPAELNCAL